MTTPEILIALAATPEGAAVLQVLAAQRVRALDPGDTAEALLALAEANVAPCASPRRMP